MTNQAQTTEANTLKKYLVVGRLSDHENCQFTCEATSKWDAKNKFEQSIREQYLDDINDAISNGEFMDHGDVEIYIEIIISGDFTVESLMD
ncbi:hypothetical protein [Photobacterium leiognathi]|uniref:hypothetical protein n=1 Tax=Photobacterium leiognathi TaxID=553611 RepID=UPI0029811603|nr:hypothetical protein [Photobacterium leiognathi]